LIHSNDNKLCLSMKYYKQITCCCWLFFFLIYANSEGGSHTGAA
jgi:hypothetical protein